MRERSWAALPLVLVILAGCATKLDFDGLSALTPKDDGGLDAGQIKSDAAVPGNADSTVAPVEAGPSVHVEQAPATFSCARESPAPTLCDDFENDALLERWGDVSVSRTPEVAGTIAHDALGPRAGKNSLLAVIDEGVTPCGGCFYVGIGKDLPDFSGPTRVTIDFDVRVDAVDTRREHGVMLWRYTLGRSDIGFTQHTVVLDSAGEEEGALAAAFMEWDADGLPAGTVVDADTKFPPLVPYIYPFMPAFHLYRWSHVKYVLDSVGATDRELKVTFMVDDVVLYSGVPHYLVRGGRSRLELGFPDINASDYTEGEKTESWRVRYDNVLVRSEKLTTSG